MTPARQHARPDMIVIGAQKAGSTWLMQALDDHPDIYMPYGEVAFFEDPVYKQRGLPWLEALLKPGADHKVIGFKRPNLLAHHEAAPRVAHDLNNPRIIVVLRDPVDRAVSAYWHTMLSGRIPLRPMNEGLNVILNGTEAEQWPSGQHVLKWGEYGRHIQHWLKYVPQSHLLVSLYDDIKQQPDNMVQSVYSFLGVNEDYVPTKHNNRPMAGVYSMTRQRFRRLMLPLYQRMFDNGVRSQVRRGPAAALARRTTRAIDQLLLQPLLPNQKPQLDPDVRHRLEDYFKDDITLLQNILNRDLSHWAGRSTQSPTDTAADNKP